MKAEGRETAQSVRVVLGCHVRRVLCKDLGTLLPVVRGGMGRIEGFVGLLRIRERDKEEEEAEEEEEEAIDLARAVRAGIVAVDV